jgi:hypothetical protein
MFLVFICWWGIRIYLHRTFLLQGFLHNMWHTLACRWTSSN